MKARAREKANAKVFTAKAEADSKTSSGESRRGRARAWRGSKLLAKKQGPGTLDNVTLSPQPTQPAAGR